MGGLSGFAAEGAEGETAGTATLGSGALLAAVVGEAVWLAPFFAGPASATAGRTAAATSDSRDRLGGSTTGSSGSGRAMSATVSSRHGKPPAMIAGSSAGKPRGAGLSITVHKA